MSEIGSQNERIEIPGAIVEDISEPMTVEEVVAVVERAREGRTGLLIAGGRTRLHCANDARGISMGLSLRGLARIDEFEPDEGVVHAGAGTPIRAVQRAVEAEGWELPLDPPGETSTIGGTVATAATGPRALAFGRVADAILGLEVVAGDASISKCGGRVVKNVTGYDLAKLYCGSYGTLAIVTGAWLRLRPRPAMRRVLSVRPGPRTEAFEQCRALRKLASVRALVWSESPEAESPEVTIELGGSEQGVAYDQERIAQALEASEASLDRMDALRDARAELGDVLADGVVLRIRVRGTRCEEMTRAVLALGLSVSVDLGLGTIHARGTVDDVATLVGLRTHAKRLGGFATFEFLPRGFRPGQDVFGEQEEHGELASTLKNRFDPMGILNPGRFMAGI
jgi:glycolate oxidase FAD binding subunit